MVSAWLPCIEKKNSYRNVTDGLVKSRDWSNSQPDSQIRPFFNRIQPGGSETHFTIGANRYRVVMGDMEEIDLIRSHRISQWSGRSVIWSNLSIYKRPWVVTYNLFCSATLAGVFYQNQNVLISQKNVFLWHVYFWGVVYFWRRVQKNSGKCNFWDSTVFFIKEVYLFNHCILGWCVTYR